MNVYVVTGYATLVGMVLIGVFATRELADLCASKVGGREVHEFKIDEEGPPRV